MPPPVEVGGIITAGLVHINFTNFLQYAQIACCKPTDNVKCALHLATFSQ